MASEWSKDNGRQGVPVRGVVRPLADTISVTEAERASKQVREAVTEQQQQRSQLKRFSDENKSLSQLVLQLPDSVSHRIMVPFGKAAFFPGRLIHTNEFLVLLGENHYAERSAKQTAEILERRSQFLSMQIQNVDTQIANLEAESSFVAGAAQEAKEGLVEIREYMEPAELQNAPSFTFPGQVSSVQKARPTSTSDDEHEQLMARLSELELAEAAAGDENEDSEEEDYSEKNSRTTVPSSSRSGTSKREDLSIDDKLGKRGEFGTSDNGDDEDNESEGTSEGDDGGDENGDEYAAGEEDNDDQRWGVESEWVERPIKETPARFSPGNSSGDKSVNSQYSQRNFPLPQVTHTWRGDGKFESGHLIGEEDQGAESSITSASSRLQEYRANAPAQSKAFTGQVTEHSSGEPISIKNQQVEEASSARPISKFKLRQAQAASR